MRHRDRRPGRRSRATRRPDQASALPPIALGTPRRGVAPPPSASRLLLAGTKSIRTWLLTVSEMNDRDIAAALEERRLDAARMVSHAVLPHAASVPLCRERLVAALPLGHPLAERATVDW